MRYDLEVNITGQLTQDGLGLLSKMFYDKSENIITPARWDSMTLLTDSYVGKSDISTERYNYFRNVKDTAFVSGVSNNDSLSLFKLIIKDNVITPLFNGGDILFYRYRYSWSNNNVVKITEWNPYQHSYVCEIDNDADNETVQVFTLKMANPGYIGYNRDFTYVDYNTIEFRKILKLDLPKQSRRNIIYCCTDTGEIYEVEQSTALTVKTFDVDFFQDDLPDLPTINDRWCVVGKEKDFIFFHDGYRWRNIRADRAFKTSGSDYKFTIFNDPFNNGKKTVLTNCKKITYSSINIGVSPAQQRSLLGLPEFPIKGLEVNELNSDATLTAHYSDLHSAILVTNQTDFSKDIDCSFTVHPVVTYKQSERYKRKDTVYGNINIIPSGIGFKSGLLCVFNTFSPTIPTTYGSYLPIPIELIMSIDKGEIGPLDGVKVTAKISGIDGIPIKGAKIKFNILQDPTLRLTQWMGSGEDTFEAFTGVDGTCDAVVLQLQTKHGFFIQKNWVHENVIDVPFDIGNIDTKELYLYIITADDPILGKLSAKSSIGEIPVSDSYYRKGRLDSYEISGRKMAYVKMSSRYTPTSRVLQSAYIKPTGLIKFTDKMMFIKDLFIREYEKNRETIVNTNTEKDFTIPLGSRIITEDVSGWDNDMLPVPGKSVKQEVLVKSGVTIIYPGNIPGTAGTLQDERIVGYWLVTGSAGNVGINCSFENEVMSLSSEEVRIWVTNYIKSEREFVISESEILNQNSVLGSFGYYSISEFLKNPFNMSANVYCCVYSDPVTHSCLNKSNVDISSDQDGILTTKKISSFYSVDSVNSTTCIHTPEYDSLLPEKERCPGLDCHYVNPFILHVQK